MRRAARGPEVLSTRDLNRATLARQLLLERAPIGAVPAIERLAALQAQWAPSPYLALWSRLRDFAREDLWSAIERRRVIRARLMRGTLHLVSARDFYAYAVATQDLGGGAWNRLQIARGVDPRRVRDLAVAFAREPRAKEDVLAHLRARVRPALLGEDGWLLWRFVSAHADLVSAPPGGHWGYGGTDAPYVAARHWIARGGRPPEDEALAQLITRYVAAFGPVSLADVVRFAGQRPARVRPVLERLAPRMRCFADQRGRVLFDLPRAPRPGGDAGAPVRFLPRYDELLIGYEHRERVLDPRYRAAIYSANGIIEAAVLVDGFVAATWALSTSAHRAVVRVDALRRLTRTEKAAVASEGERLAAFLAPAARRHGVRV